jgi:hypothetical protein
MKKLVPCALTLTALMLVACAQAGEPTIQEVTRIVKETVVVKETVIVVATPEPTHLSLPSEQPTEAPAVTGSIASPISAGSPVSYECYYDSGCTVSVLSTVRGADAWAAIEDANMFNDKPAEGMEYVLIDVLLSYDKGEDPLVGRRITFKSASTLTGQLYDDPSVVEPEPGVDDLELLPGAKAEGWVAIQVPIDDPSPILVLYDASEGYIYVALPEEQ